jgi:hypothetical protein
MSTSNDEGSRRPSGRAGALATLTRRRPQRPAAADDHVQSRAGRAVAVAELAAGLQRYTVVAGAPGSSTTELLAQLAGALRVGDPARPVVFVDPKGDGRYMLSRHADISNPGVTVHVGPDASLDRIADLIGAVPGGCDVLIDNAPMIVLSPAHFELLETLLRSLRHFGHRLVLQVHAPDDLPALPAPDTFCVFPLLAMQDAWQHSTWAGRYPDLAAAAAGFDDPAVAGRLGRCVVVALPDGDSGEPAGVRGVVDVGPEPERPRP